MDVQEITARVQQKYPAVLNVVETMSQVMVGQKVLLQKLCMGLLADGHILVEGVPGLAKTTAIRCLADAMDASFSRIQFTPDLLPADIVGTEIYSPKDGTFKVKQGPVHANLVLADEINRAPAKVQSALLEAMQEKQVTIGSETFNLPKPFLVLATQNPVEQEGTYPLPEAQVDRFMIKLIVDYPEIEDEIVIMKRMSGRSQPQVTQSITLSEIEELKSLVSDIFVDDKIYNYVANLVAATRYPAKYGLEDLGRLLTFGASPRASISMIKCAKAFAFLQGRGYVTPQDIKSVGMDVMRHRIMLSYEAEAQDTTVEEVLQKVFDNVDVP